MFQRKWELNVSFDTKVRFEISSFQNRNLSRAQALLKEVFDMKKKLYSGESRWLQIVYGQLLSKLAKFVAFTEKTIN